MTKTIIITGSSDGIGAELARQLAAPGVTLVLAARRIDALQAVAKRCEAKGAKALVMPTDVSDPSQCEALISAAVAQTGRIDALINNAGVSAHALLQDVKAQDLRWYEDLMRINLWGSVWCTHAALPHLLNTKGQVVAVGSLAGLVGVPGRTAYCATKFAMTGFFEALRTELKPTGVSVTLAYPGVVATNIRVNGLNAKGERAGSSGLIEDGAMSVEACAQLIIQGMQKRQRNVVMTAKGKLGQWLKLIAPGVVENLALKAVKADFRPH
jgi:short-subunit dehydrogenase